MLRPAKSNAFCSEINRLHSVFRGISIGTHRHRFILIGKFHNSAEIATAYICRNSRNQGVVDIACGTVQRNRVALVERFAAKFKLLVVLVHSDILTAGHAAGSHTAGNNGRMRGLPAAHGHNTL